MISVSQSWFGPSAVNSCQSGPSLPVSMQSLSRTAGPGFFLLRHRILPKHAPPTVLRPDLPRRPLRHHLPDTASLVSQEPIPELRAHPDAHRTTQRLVGSTVIHTGSSRCASNNTFARYASTISPGMIRTASHR